MTASHEALSCLSHLCHRASSSSHPKPWCSFPNTVGLKAEAFISKRHSIDSSILVRLDLHPAGRAVKDWASYWCNTPSNNIAPCCYDNATQCVRECWLSPCFVLRKNLHLLNLSLLTNSPLPLPLLLKQNNFPFLKYSPLLISFLAFEILKFSSPCFFINPPVSLPFLQKHLLTS